MVRQEIEKPPAANPERGTGGLSLQELLQVRERVKGERLPLFVIKDNERSRMIAKMWRIPGTSVRVSPEGDIYYPVWQERTRLNKPELYVPCSPLPRGWSFERLLASQRRPISEMVYHQVRKDNGAVEAAVRSMDHVLERYQDKGRELEQIEAVRGQIEQALGVLQETRDVSKEEFEEGFAILYQRTILLLESSGMTKSSLALKRDISRLLEEASTGKDKTGRKNLVAMLKKVEAAAKRVEYRRSVIGFNVDKFMVNKTGLLVQREKDRRILGEARYQLESGFAGHEVFRSGRAATPLQRGVLIGLMGTLIYRLEQTKVKCYKTTARDVISDLNKVQGKVKAGDFLAARPLFQESLERVTKILENFELSAGKFQL